MAMRSMGSDHYCLGKIWFCEFKLPSKLNVYDQESEEGGLQKRKNPWLDFKINGKLWALLLLLLSPQIRCLVKVPSDKNWEQMERNFRLRRRDTSRKHNISSTVYATFCSKKGQIRALGTEGEWLVEVTLQAGGWARNKHHSLSPFAVLPFCPFPQQSWYGGNQWKSRLCLGTKSDLRTNISIKLFLFLLSLISLLIRD